MVTTAYFLATDDDLNRACRGWRIPSVEPRHKTSANPFTGEPMVVDDYNPTPGAPFPGANATVAFSGLAHLELSGVDITRLASLMQVLLKGADWSRCYRPARIGPPEAEQAVCSVPAELVSAIATTPEDNLPSVTEQWLAVLREEAGAIDDEETRKLVMEGLVAEAFLPMLASLRNLARQAVLLDRKMYCFMAP